MDHAETRLITTEGAISHAWADAGKKLGIRVVAPFDLVVGGKAYRFPAFLPHFGGPRGMVVLAYESFFQEKGRVASESGLFCSGLASEGYLAFSKAHFIETLLDWGYFGPDSEKRGWMNRPSPWVRKP
jgi:hypothetical protein